MLSPLGLDSGLLVFLGAVADLDLELDGEHVGQLGAEPVASPDRPFHRVVVVLARQEMAEHELRDVGAV